MTFRHFVSTLVRQFPNRQVYLFMFLHEGQILLPHLRKMMYKLLPVQRWYRIFGHPKIFEYAPGMTFSYSAETSSSSQLILENYIFQETEQGVVVKMNSTIRGPSYKDGTTVEWKAVVFLFQGSSYHQTSLSIAFYVHFYFYL